MKTSELFALNQWLSDYPEDMSYNDVLAGLREDAMTYEEDSICPWFLVEDCTGEQIAQFIEDTRESFEYFTKGKI